MHPVLIQVGFFRLHSWGLMLAIAFVVGSLVAERRAARKGIMPHQVLDLTLVILISGVVGARIPYVIEHWSEFRIHPVSALYLWQGGMAFYGGFVLAFLVSVLYLRRRGIPLWRMADVIAPSLGLGLFFGRLGCFLNGCCYGKPTSLPWGVVFPDASPAGWDFPGVPVHPTQLYSAAAGLLIYLVLVRLDRSPRYDGFLFWSFAAMYGGWRFLVDFVRHYSPETYWLKLGGIDLTVNQLASILVSGTAFIFMYWLRRRGASRSGEGSQTCA